MFFALLMGLWSLYSHKIFLGRGPDGSEPQEDPFRLTNASLFKLDPPAILRDDIEAKSFAAQPQFDVRLPHGPNPDAHYINSYALLANPTYRKKYQQNLHDLRILNQDWRLDVTTNSPINNFSNTLTAEPHICDRISKYHDQRFRQRRNLTAPKSVQLTTPVLYDTNGPEQSSGYHR